MIMEIINLGHASFLIKGENISVVTDPYRNHSVPHLKMPRIQANYVTVSHDHYDHDAKNLVTIIPTDHELKCEAIMVAHDHHNGAHRGLNKMYLFEIDGLRILHTGDLGCIPLRNILEQMMNVDILLAPINGHFTISAEELKAIMDVTKPRITIPMHYYKKEDNSGYPDGGQIDIFKKLVGEYLEVEDRITVNDELFKNRVVIFNKAVQE